MLMSITLYLLSFAFFSPTVPAEEGGGVLAAGTRFETPWVQIDGAAPGPTVFIVGGMHGNEPAGYVAAETITHWSIARGRLVVVPRACAPAIAADERTTPGLPEKEANLNRHFPSEAPPHAGIAAELWALVETQEPDWLLDLHEGYDIKRVNSKSVGRSVIACDDPLAREMAEVLVALADSTIESSEHYFTLLRNPIAGSLARAAWDRLGIRSMIVETTFKGGSVPARARRHRLLVHAVLTRLDMGPCDPNTLVDPARCGDRPRVALYAGSGASASSIRATRTALTAGDELVVRHLDAEDIRAGRLSRFDLVVHPGGSGSKQGRALGEEGRRLEREFVREGGAFLGVCAGAYLAAANYDWSLAVIDAEVIDRAHWRRGRGDIPIEATRRGREWLGAPKDPFELRYINGPILAPAERPEIPDYVTLLIFRGEVAENGAPSGVMPGTPAAVVGTFGEGQAMAVSPHPERTPGRGAMLRSAVSWLVEGAKQREPAAIDR